MKLKIKKSRWFYKKGDVIEVPGHKQMCSGVMCYTKERDGKTYYIHPDDVEEIKKTNPFNKES